MNQSRAQRRGLGDSVTEAPSCLPYGLPAFGKTVGAEVPSRQVAGCPIPAARATYAAGGISTESMRYTVALAVWTPPQMTLALSLTMMLSPLPETVTSAP